MVSKKAQNQKLLIVNAHYLRRLETSLPEKLDPAGLVEVNTQLALWLPGWLDELSDELTGKKADSPTREKAVKRCLAAIEAEAGLKFPEPHIYSTEGLAMNDLTQGSKTVSSKKPVAKVPPKVTPPKAKAASKPVTKVAAKPAKAEGEFEKQKITLVTKENPKRTGSEAHKRYGYYATSKTVGDFLKKGGTALDIRYDKAAGHIRLSKP